VGTISSAASTTAAATAASSAWWLKDPTLASLDATVEVVLPFDTDRAERQGVFEPLGREFPVVVADALLGESGTLTIDCYTGTAYTQLEALRATQRVLLLQSPLGDQWYVRLGDNRRASMTFAPSASLATRTITIDWVEVDSPT
jgi:hypothetical protein